MSETPQSSLPQFMQDEAKRRGYRFEFSEDGNEERVIRPDGTVAIVARRMTAVRPVSEGQLVAWGTDVVQRPSHLAITIAREYPVTSGDVQAILDRVNGDEHLARRCLDARMSSSLIDWARDHRE